MYLNFMTNPSKNHGSLSMELVRYIGKGWLTNALEAEPDSNSERRRAHKSGIFTDYRFG